MLLKVEMVGGRVLKCTRTKCKLSGGGFSPRGRFQVHKKLFVLVSVEFKNNFCF